MEHCKAITTRSCIVIKTGVSGNLEKERVVVEKQEGEIKECEEGEEEQ